MGPSIFHNGVRTNECDVNQETFSGMTSLFIWQNETFVAKMLLLQQEAANNPPDIPVSDAHFSVSSDGFSHDRYRF